MHPDYVSPDDIANELGLQDPSEIPDDIDIFHIMCCIAKKRRSAPIYINSCNGFKPTLAVKSEQDNKSSCPLFISPPKQVKKHYTERLDQIMRASKIGQGPSKEEREKAKRAIEEAEAGLKRSRELYAKLLAKKAEREQLQDFQVAESSQRKRRTREEYEEEQRSKKGKAKETNEPQHQIPEAPPQPRREREPFARFKNGDIRSVVFAPNPKGTYIIDLTSRAGENGQQVRVLSAGLYKKDVVEGLQLIKINHSLLKYEDAVKQHPTGAFWLKDEEIYANMSRPAEARKRVDMRNGIERPDAYYRKFRLNRAEAEAMGRPSPERFQEYIDKNQKNIAHSEADINRPFFKRLVNDFIKHMNKGYTYRFNIAFEYKILTSTKEENQGVLGEESEGTSTQKNIFLSPTEDNKTRVEEWLNKLSLLVKNNFNRLKSSNLTPAGVIIAMMRVNVLAFPIKVGTDILVSHAIANQVFSPINNTFCMIDCMRHLGIELKGGFMNRIKKALRIKKFDGIPSTHLAKFFENVDIDNKHIFHVYTFDWRQNTIKKTPKSYPIDFINSRQDPDVKQHRLLEIHIGKIGHMCVLLPNAKLDMIKRSHFSVISTETREVDEEESAFMNANEKLLDHHRELLNIEHEPKPLIFDQSKFYTYDLETAIHKRCQCGQNCIYRPTSVPTTLMMPDEELINDIGEPCKKYTSNHMVNKVVTLRHDQVYAYSKRGFDKGNAIEHVTILDDGEYTIDKGAQAPSFNPKDGPHYMLKSHDHIAAKAIIHKGYDAAEQFIRYVTELANTIKKRCDDEVMDSIAMSKKDWTKSDVAILRRRVYERNTVKFWAHNGGRYDIYIIMAYHNDFTSKVTRIMKQNGGYSCVEFDNVIIFQDSYKHCSEPLNKLCDTYNLGTKFGKGSAPYKYFKMCNIDSVGPIERTKGFWNEGWPIKHHLSPIEQQDAIDKWCDKTGVDPACFYPPDDPDYKEWDAGEHDTRYCVNDVIALMIVLHRYAFAMHQITKNSVTGNGFNPLECISLSQFTYKAWCTDVNFDVTKRQEFIDRVEDLTIGDPVKEPRLAIKAIYESLCVPEDQRLYVSKNHRVDKLERQATKGGRVGAALAAYVHPYYDTIKRYSDELKEIERMEIPNTEKQTRLQEKSNMMLEFTKDINCTIAEAFSGEMVSPKRNYMETWDASSLYPSAMWIGQFPTGIPKFMKGDTLDHLLELLNDPSKHHLIERISVLKVDMVFTDKSIVYPIVPVSVKDGQTMYDFFDKVNYVSTSIDIMQYVKFNAVRITKIHWCYEWPGKRAIFREYIEKLYRQRITYKKEGNDVLSECCKSGMNSLYGKLIQAIIDTETKIIDNIDEIEQLFNKDQLGEFIEFVGINDPDNPAPFGGVRIMVDVKKNETNSSERELANQISRCPILGAVVLAYSKMLMNEAVDVMGGFRNIDAIAYWDTDSGYSMHSDYLRLMWEPIPEGQEEAEIAAMKAEEIEVKEGRLKVEFRIHLVDPTGKFKRRVNPWGLMWVTASTDKNDSFMTQFHDDTDKKFNDPKILRFFANAPKVKSIEYTGTKKYSETRYKDTLIFRHNLNETTCTTSAVVATSKIGEEYDKRYVHVLGEKTSFKGYKTSEDAKGESKAKVIAKYQPGTTLKDIHEINRLGAEPENGLHGTGPLRLDPNGAKLGPEMLKEMQETLAPQEIAYSSFTRNQKVRGGIETKVVKKVLNVTQWSGRFRSNNRYLPWGSSLVPEEENAKRLEFLKTTHKARDSAWYN